MRKTAAGRWVPDKPPPPPPPGPDTELAGLQARARDALAAGVHMPETWPVLMLWATAGREVLRERGPR